MATTPPTGALAPHQNRVPLNVQGVAHAPEARRLLLWGDNELVIIDYRGNVLAQRSFPRSRIRSAAVDVRAEHVFVALRGWGILGLDGGLMKKWSRPVSRPIAVACSPFGEYVAVGLEDSYLCLYDGYGRRVRRAETIRPPHQILFVADWAGLYAAGDTTFVMCTDTSLEELWRERVLSPIGPIAAPGTGAYLLVSTFSYGLERYRQDGEYEGGYHVRSGSRWVSVDYDGARIAVLTLDNYAVLLDHQGVIEWEWPLPGEPAGVALSAGGDRLVVAYRDGLVECYHL